MGFEIGPLKNLAPALRPGAGLDADPAVRLRKTMVVGGLLVGVFIGGLLIWAAASPIESATAAPAMIKVEASRKMIRHREGGTVQAILVREGQHVSAGQVLIRMNDVQAKMTLDVVQNQLDSLLAQSARFQAEASDAAVVRFPAELTARSTDPRVAGMIRDQEFLFMTRRQFYQSQTDILSQRIEQIQTQSQGVQAQIDALDQTVDLTRQELAGYQTLYEKGFAPKTLILRYERTLADLAGRRGALTSDLNRLQQQVGETKFQLAAQRDQRISQAADGLRQMETNIEDIRPRLSAAQELFAGTTIRSPVDGYVLNLTQHTIGGVVGQGELLMEIVPSDSPLSVVAQIRPDEVDDVHPGMKARVQLVAFNARKVSPVEAVVRTVSADQLVDQNGRAYFSVELNIPPAELAKLPKGARLTPGMPARAMIVTGKQTVLSYLVGPLTDTFRDAMKEP
jgi:HlyD family type I secretion membrane fusion protein